MYVVGSARAAVGATHSRDDVNTIGTPATGTLRGGVTIGSQRFEAPSYTGVKLGALPRVKGGLSAAVGVLGGRPDTVIVSTAGIPVAPAGADWRPWGVFSVASADFV